MPRHPSYFAPSLAARVVVPAALLSTLAAALRAQTPAPSSFRFETFAARNESASTFGGLALAGYSGLLGLRVSGAVAGLDRGSNDRITTVPVRSCSRYGCRTVMANRYGDMSLFSTKAWSVDADLIVEPFRTVPVLRQLLLGFSPYSFIGIGRHATNGALANAPDTSRAVWSYGVGVHHDLVSRLGVMGEARVRRSVEDNGFVGGSMREAMQYRVGLSFGLGGGARKTRTPVTVVARRPIPAPTTPSERAAQAPPQVGEVETRDVAALLPALLDAADALLDAPWKEGGTSPDDGFDAGGFVQYVFAQADVRVPRLVRELAVSGTSVTTRIGSLRPGDLLFFANDGMNPDHVGLYVGRDRFIHASASGNGVRYDVLGDGTRGTWFAEHLYSARRLAAGRAAGTRAPAPTLTPSGRPDRAPRPAEVP